MMKIRAALLAGLLSLSGCAAWKVDKSAVVAPEQVTRIGQEIEKVREFQQAVYEVSTFAVDRCELKVRREPFTLMTTGHLANVYDANRIAAYWHAGGFDETWRVLWAADESGLRPAQRVLEINGKPIENNKTGMGGFPLVIYLDQTSRARDGAAEGKPYEITLEGGARIAVKGVPACRTLVWASPLFDEDNAFFQVSPAVHGATILPPNAVRAARTRDEFRYLAALAVYYTASAEGVGRARTGRVLSMIGAAGVLGATVTAPLVGVVVNPLVAQGVNAGANAITQGSAGARAGVFAGKIVADMGGDPLAGLALAQRLEAAKIKAPGVALSAEERQFVRQALASQ